jgi:hypothetical protein
MFNMEMKNAQAIVKKLTLWADELAYFDTISHQEQPLVRKM